MNNVFTWEHCSVVCRNFKFSRILKYYLFFRLDFGFAEIRTQDKLLFLRTTFWCNLTRDYSIDTLYKLSITILTVKFASYHLLSLLHCWSSLINNNLRFLIVKETADVIADAIFRKRLKLHNWLCSFNISLVEFDPLWWWVLMDSNHRPLRYQHSALTNWAKDPIGLHQYLGGGWRDRTDDPLLAKQVLSQLS